MATVAEVKQQVEAAINTGNEAPIPAVRGGVDKLNRVAGAAELIKQAVALITGVREDAGQIPFAGVPEKVDDAAAQMKKLADGTTSELPAQSAGSYTRSGESATDAGNTVERLRAVLEQDASALGAIAMRYEGNGEALALVAGALDKVDISATQRNSAAETARSFAAAL